MTYACSVIASEIKFKTNFTHNFIEVHLKIMSDTQKKKRLYKSMSIVNYAGDFETDFN